MSRTSISSASPAVRASRAFAREATLRNLETRITVLYSVRSPRNIIFREQFHELAQQNPNFYFYVTCTRIDDGSIGEEAEWKGRRGRISPVWVMEHVHDLKNTIFYACGPNELVEFAEEIVLRGLNLPKEQMKTEKWG